MNNQNQEEAEKITKGFYGLFNSNSDTVGITTKKKGSEIKLAIQKIIGGCIVEQIKIMDKMQAELEHIPFTPDVTMKSECCPMMNSEMIPKKFSYDMLYHNEKYINSGGRITETSMSGEPTKEQRSEMIEYNNYAYDYLYLCEKRYKLEVARNNIDDNRNYTLSVDMLASLGM